MPARTSVRYSASPVTLRSGLAAAIASTEWLCSRWITPFQLADSANAPWTRTTVGFALGMADLLRVRGRRAQHVDRLRDGGGAARVGRGRASPCGRWDVPAQPRAAHRPATRKKPRRSALPRSRPPVLTRRSEQGPTGPSERPWRDES